jgi:hypothetical protein
MLFYTEMAREWYFASLYVTLHILQLYASITKNEFSSFFIGLISFLPHLQQISKNLAYRALVIHTIVDSYI